MKALDTCESKIMKAVYCYYFPESREVMDAYARLPDSLFRVTSRVEDAQRDLDKIVQPSLALPATPEGCVDLDMIHEPIIERILTAYEDTLPGLSDFAFRYPTSGSSEGIFHLLSQLKTRGVTEINVFAGEYEGYGIQAENLGIKTHMYDAEALDIPSIEPGYWFISQPSARDGNILPEEIISSLCAAGNKLVLDFAYVGATAPHVFPALHENIVGAVMSFSKPYGVFRQRTGGFTFTREKVPTLFGNKWFKDVGRLFQALGLAENIGPCVLYETYRSVQESAVKEINEEFGLGVHASDTLLLAYLRKEEATHLDPEQQALIAPYARGDRYRFCLTPYFEACE